MRKRITAIFAILMSLSLYALPLGNPAEASLMTEGIFWSNVSDCFGLRLGFYGDYVFDRKLQTDGSGNHATITEYKITTNAGYLALNYCDRWDLFGTIGSSHIEFLSHPRVLNFSANPTFDVDFDADLDFSWSVGVRGSLCDWRCWLLGLEAQYFSTTPNLNSAVSPGGIPVYPDGIEIDYREWQVGLGLSYLLDIPCCCTSIVPYFGVRWAYVNVDADRVQFPLSSTNTAILHDLEAQHQWGYSIGVTVVKGCWGSLTAEGRFLNETAFYFNAQINL